MKINYLPKEAYGLHGWLRNLFTQIGPLDRTDDGVLAKTVLFLMKNRHKRSLCARDPSKGGC